MGRRTAKKHKNQIIIQITHLKGCNGFFRDNFSLLLVERTHLVKMEITHNAAWEFARRCRRAAVLVSQCRIAPCNTDIDGPTCFLNADEKSVKRYLSMMFPPVLL